MLLITSRESAESATSEFVLGSRFALGKNEVAIAANFSDDEQLAREFHSHLGSAIDLLEPFARIREALEEAQKSVRPAAA